MLFSDFLYRGAHHFQKQFVNAAGIPVFPEQGVPQPVQALDYEGGFLRRICDKVFLFLHLACLLCASIIYGGEDSRKCAIFRLGLSHEAPTLLDFFGEIYSSAAKNLDFMRVCESVVMNIGTKNRPFLRLQTLTKRSFFHYSAHFLFLQKFLTTIYHYKTGRNCCGSLCFCSYSIRVIEICDFRKVLYGFKSKCSTEVIVI